jgi:hypothetical protein
MSTLLNKSNELIKRTWYYTQPPSVYQIAPCSCGNEKTQWSEFAGHLWCAQCKKDFKPAHNGVFDGPISTGVAKLFGVIFDRVDIKTGKLDKFYPENGQYESDILKD